MIFLNGRLVPLGAAAVDPADRGLLLGDGVFETLRVYRGRPGFLARHLERLRAGAAALRIPAPEWDVEKAVAQVLKANGLEERDATLRITLTRGPGPRGLLPPTEPRPSLLVAAAPLNPKTFTGLARVVVSEIRRNEQSPLSRLKTLNYLDNVLARMAAADKGADEALLLNSAGRVASASAANIFLVRGRSLLTPPPSEGVLAGVTRAVVLEAAQDLDLTPAEVPLGPELLASADEAFLTSSLVEVRGIAELDGRRLGDDTGPVTQRLLEAYRRKAPG